MFSYDDTHRHRLGANWMQIPVNCPYKARVRNMQRDGPMNVDDNQGGAPNYFPNSFNGPKDDKNKYKMSEYRVTGDVARHDTANDDNFAQVRKNLMIVEMVLVQYLHSASMHAQQMIQ